jgi:manganese/zinc/iron transport system ATP- binding protein
VELLRDLKERGKTLIVVHHDLSTAREYFDKLMLLNMRLVAYGEMEKTFTPDLLQKTYGGRLTILSDVAGQAAGRSEFEQEGPAERE